MPCLADAAGSGAEVAESHMVGGGAVKVGASRPAPATNPPDEVVARVSPLVVTVLNCREDSRGSWAALRVLTTSTSLNPPCLVAVTTKSTSGSTLSARLV